MRLGAERGGVVGRDKNPVVTMLLQCLGQRCNNALVDLLQGLAYLVNGLLVIYTQLACSQPRPDMPPCA